MDEFTGITINFEGKSFRQVERNGKLRFVEIDANIQSFNDPIDDDNESLWE